jgi:hypothetical protein
MGLLKILSLLEELEKQHGARFTPAPILRERAARDQRFYT